MRGLRWGAARAHRLSGRGRHALGAMVAVIAVALGMVGLVTATAAAQPTCTDTWNGSGGDNLWEDPANWSTQAVPGGGDVACWGAGITVDVTASGDVADSIQGGNLAITSTGGLSLTNAADPSSVGSLSIDGGGTLSATGQSFAVSGSFNWGGSTGGNATLNGATLTAGTIAINNGTSTPTVTGSPTLSASGAMTFQAAGDVSGSAAFTAAGVVPAAGIGGFGGNSLTLTGGTTTVASGETLDSGALSIDAGATVAVNGGGTLNASSTTIASGATLTDDGTVNNAVTLNGGTLTDDGTVSGGATVNSGTLTVDGTVSGGVTLDGGTLAGTGSVGGIVDTSGTVSPGDPAPGILTDTGSFSQGSSGTVDVVIAGTTAGSGYSELSVSGSASLGGNLSVTDSNFTPLNGVTFTPVTYASASGSFTLTGPNASIYGQSTGATAVTLTANTAPPNCPAGSDVFTPTSGSSGDWVGGGTWSPAVPGAGSIACWATSTTVDVGSGDNVSAAEVQGGALAIDGGALTLTSAADTSDLSTLSLTTAGTLQNDSTLNSSSTSVSGAGSQLTDDGAVSSVTLIAGGTLAGTGTVGGIVDTSGVVSPGDPAPGILTDTGSFSQGSSGTVDVVIAGTTAGSGYSQLSVSGSASLGGNLSVTDSNFTPLNGVTFTPVTYGSATGSFTLTGPNASIYGQSTGTTAVTLTANTAPPNCPAGSDVFTPTSGSSGDWVGGGTWSPAVPGAGSIACWATSTTVDVGSGDNVSAAEVQGGALAIDGGALTLTSAADTSDLSTLSLTAAGTLQNDSTLNTSSTSVSGAGSQLTDDGSVSSSVTLTTGGALAGTGSVGGIVDTSGTVSPGDPAPGILTDTGNFSQGSGGTVAILIEGTTAGSGYSQLSVSGSASLGGNLSVTDSNFAPATGQTFTPVTYGSHSGAFSLTGPDAGSYLVTAGGSGVTLTGFVPPANCPAGSDVFTPASGNEGDWVGGGTWLPSTPGSGSIACWAPQTTVDVGTGDAVSAAEIQGGALNVDGGRLTLTSASDASTVGTATTSPPGTYALSLTSGGTLGGAAQTLTVGGNFTWGDATSTTALNPSPNNGLKIDETSGSLTIGAAGGGAETWGGGSITAGGPTTIDNQVSDTGAPTLDANGGLTLGDVNLPASGSPGTINAAGIATGSGTSSVLGFALDVTAGTNAIAGVLNVQDLTTDFGTTVTVPGGSTLSVNSGTISGLINGAGAFSVGGATTITSVGGLGVGSVTALSGPLTVNSGAGYVVAGATTIAAGTLDLRNGASSTGSLSLTGAGSLTGTGGATLTVGGPIAWSGDATINGGGGGLAITQTAGAFSVTAPTAALGGGSIDTGSTVSIGPAVGAATFDTSGAATLTTSSNIVLGSATVVSGSGSTFFANGLGGGPIDTTYNFGGDGVNLTGGATTLAAAGHLDTGPLTISGGTLQDDGAIVASGTNLVTGGTLSGTGGVTGTVTNTSGTVSPGDAPAPGKLTIHGNYSQPSGGTLAIEINGSTTPGSDYSQLAVSGTATLSFGSLSLADGGGFVPEPPSETFTVLSSTSTRSGTFGSLTGPAAAAYFAQYSNSKAVILGVNPTPGNVAPPSIGGTPAVGQTLTCSPGTWSANPTSFAYVWNRGGSPIPGAASSTYIVTKSDQGQALTCTVTASNNSGSGLAATSGAVVVPAAPSAPKNTAVPAISGKPTPGTKLTCAPGTWSGTPTGFAYRWNRNGSAIPGATSASYTLQIGDEAASLTCTVTASNAVGPGMPATSASFLVVLPGTLSCAKPTGGLGGTRLGPLALGTTRARARHILTQSGTSGNADRFCLYGGWDITAGYPSNKLLRTLPRGQRRQVKGKVVLALTVNPYYALNGAHPGMTLGSVSKQLQLGKPFHLGSNLWYITSSGASHGVLKVRGGIIQEVGIANKRLTRSRAAQQRFLGSFSTD